MAEARLFSRSFALCAAPNFAQELSFHLFLHFPVLVRRLGGGEAEIGWIWSISAISALIGRLPIGRAMDARGRRLVFLAGGVLNVFACALYLTVDALGPWIYAIRIVHGLAGAMLFTGLFTYAADCAPPGRRTEALGLFGVTGMLALAVAGVAGEAILARFAFDALFVAAIACGLAAVALAAPLREVRGDAFDAFDAGDAGEEGSDSDAEAGAAPPSAWRVSRAIPLWCLAIVLAAALEAVFAFTKTFLAETRLGAAGAFFFAYAGAAIAVRVVLGWVPERLGHTPVLVAALAALAAGIATLGWASGDASVIVAGALCGIGHGYAFPIVFALAVARAPARARGSAMATCVACFDVGALAGGPVFGHVIERGGYPAGFHAAALALVVGGAVFALWERAR